MSFGLVFSSSLRTWRAFAPPPSDVDQRRGVSNLQIAARLTRAADRFFVGRGRIFPLALPLVELAELREVARIDFGGLDERLLRFIELALRDLRFVEEQQRLRRPRRLRRDLLENRHREIGLAGAQLQAAERHLQVRIRRHQRRVLNRGEMLDRGIARRRLRLSRGRRRAAIGPRGKHGAENVVGFDVVLVDLQRLLGRGHRIGRTILAVVITGNLGGNLRGFGIELARALERREGAGGIAGRFHPPPHHELELRLRLRILRSGRDRLPVAPQLARRRASDEQDDERRRRGMNHGILPSQPLNR